MPRTEHKPNQDSYEPLICTIQAGIDANLVVDIPAEEFLNSVQVYLPSAGIATFEVMLTDAKHVVLMNLISRMKYGYSWISVSFGRAGDRNPTFKGVITEGMYNVSPESTSVTYRAVSDVSSNLFQWSTVKPIGFHLSRGTSAKDAFSKVSQAIGFPIEVDDEIKDIALPGNFAVAISEATRQEETWFAVVMRLAGAFSDSKYSVTFSARIEDGKAVGYVSRPKSFPAKSVNHHYAYTLSNDSEILSLKVDDRCLTAAYLATATAHASVDATSGKVANKTEIDTAGNPNDASIYRPAESVNVPHAPAGTGSQVRTVMIAEAFGAIGAETVAKRLDRSSTAISCSMVVRGTHDVMPLDVISLDFSPPGYKGRHFLTNRYRVLTAQHSFSSQGWVTSFAMVSEFIPDEHPNSSSRYNTGGRNLSAPITPISVSDLSRVDGLTGQSREALAILTGGSRFDNFVEAAAAGAPLRLVPKPSANQSVTYDAEAAPRPRTTPVIIKTTGAPDTLKLEE